ncbi:superoxide dismutase [Endozoicomonas sp. (ex Bugula neritina AB1)]|nr:superoxide dismutase [Endozoicomonas sp. (ex Bugula neritina AB1)]
MKRSFIKRKWKQCLALLLASSVGFAVADQTIKIYQVSAKEPPDGMGAEIGTIIISQTPEGVRFQPLIMGLTPGEHGFHVHENPSCGKGEKNGMPMAALKAGGHYDPDKTGRHEGPYGKGHRGDLPRLLVDENGNATKAVVAPRLTLKELSGRSLMIHAGGDNYTDNPPMGGGGTRIACGVIK